ncbi:MAG TPA: 2'-deoxycytidine 5'-triphosphate deaminase [Aestuariivirgaceae bacterium]|jgi:dCTP deaminase
MSEKNGLPLFPADHDDEPPSNVVALRNTGILPAQQIQELIGGKSIVGTPESITSDQIQPASLDLRLGTQAFRVRASFLPGPNSAVMERVTRLEGSPIDLSAGAVFERGVVYVAKLMENVDLGSDIEGTANPKSSTGRLDVLTRLITDKATAFDRIPAGHKGPLYVEVAPLTFSIVVRKGSRLNQVRLSRGRRAMAPATKIQQEYEEGRLVSVDGEPLPLRQGLVPVTVDLVGSGRGSVIGYKAKHGTNTIDVDRVNHYDPREYWEKITSDGGRLSLDPDSFYILATREQVGVPPRLAAEMIPFDPNSGEFRIHYAGFFDPGFGWRDGRAQGSRAVLEVRAHGVPFILEHGQHVGWLRYSEVLGGKPDRLYGEGIASNYQGQGVALAKHFKTWPD